MPGSGRCSRSFALTDVCDCMPSQHDPAIEITMKSFRKELWFQTSTRRAFINITPEVNRCIRESGVSEGLVLVNAMHITASVFINDDESGLHHDYELWLERRTGSA